MSSDDCEKSFFSRLGITDGLNMWVGSGSILYEQEVLMRMFVKLRRGDSRWVRSGIYTLRDTDCMQ